MESERQTAGKSFEDVHASNFLSGIDKATLTTQVQKAARQTSLLYLSSNNIKKTQLANFISASMCSNRGHFALSVSVFVLAACCHLRVGLSFNGGVFTLQSTLSHPRLQTVSPSVFRSGWQIGDESCSQHGSHRERVQLTLYLRHLMRDAQRGKKHKGGRDGRQTGDRNLWREGHRKKTEKRTGG